MELRRHIGVTSIEIVANIVEAEQWGDDLLQQGVNSELYKVTRHAVIDRQLKLAIQKIIQNEVHDLRIFSKEDWVRRRVSVEGSGGVDESR